MKQRYGKWIFVFLILMVSFVPAWAGDQRKTKDQGKREVKTEQLDDIVVSATRAETRKEEIPSVITIIKPLDIETTVDSNITRLLKKNSSVDVIDYPGVLSGISIRGFRPEFSGITKHSLILIDGRPAGAENIASILKTNVERIEILKGPASSLYGAEAMGGVVNIITKKSKGKIKTSITAGVGSFATHYESIVSGGSITDKMDYDFSMSNKDQNDDFTMGSGEDRANTSYQEMNGALRLGSSLTDTLRIDIKADLYAGRDIKTPNAMHYEDQRPSQKDIDRLGGDLSVKKKWGNNKTSLTIYASNEEYDTTKKYVGDTPYKSYAKKTEWMGTQLSNTYKLKNHDITTGFDYQTISVESESYNSDESRKAPYSPDNGRDNIGVYADGFFRLFNDSLILNAGLRYDTFDLETKNTPYKTDFTPNTESFDIVNPRAGFKYFFDEDRIFQTHATIGTAFVPPEANKVAGYSERELSDGTIMYNRGNPNLDPEKSITWDGGFSIHNRKFGFFIDLTYFQTKVDDKITSLKVSDTENTYTNAFEADISGLEWELSQNLGALLEWDRKIEIYFNGTYFIESKEQISKNEWRDIHNVSDTKFNTGITYNDNTFFGKFNIRYMGERKDSDWYTSGYPEIIYDDFTVCDLSAGVRFKKNHKVKISVDNIFDKDYFEKPEYPMPGRAVYADYTFTF